MKLVDAEEKYLKEYKEAYLMSLQKVKEGVIKKHDLMFSNPDEVDIVKQCIDDKDITKLPKGYVPSYDYFIINEDKFIGKLNIRTKLTPALLNYGGNIGYAIHPKYWKKGYGTKALALGIEKSKEIGLKDKVLLTCDDDNIGSAKIIEHNGGILENKVENIVDDEKFLTRRYWIDLD